MARVLTAADVETAGRRLVLGAGDRLTPLARDRAKELGVAVEYQTSASDARAAVTASSAAPPAVAPAVARPAARRAAPAGSKVPATQASHPPVLPPSGALYRRNAIGPGPSPAAATVRRPKAGVVGAGHVGAMTALRMTEGDLFSEVAIVDVVPGLAAGLALDMWHGAGLGGFTTRVSGGEDLALLSGSEYVVITAGRPRQPGMSRTDLTAVNAEIMTSVCRGIRAHAPDATLVVVSNPLEEMTHLAARLSGLPDERVVGMAGVLDSARFRALVGLAGKAQPQDVRAIALGSHGPEMVIPLSQAFVGSRPIEDILDPATLQAVVERTRESGAEIVKLLQKGSAYFSPAASVYAMIRAMVWGSGEVLCACVRSRGAYGTADTRVGLPVRLNRRGVEEIVALDLRPAELEALQEAAARIAGRIAELPAPG